ncbi:VOC family protein [Xanthobacter autotrophicus]|uniref:VOC family protein n=1 Tax=Xanthobacter autotrophicus TaxID=280 RepID=UPI003AB97A67
MPDRLKSVEVRFFTDLHDGPYGLTICVADPDGTKVELYQVARRPRGEGSTVRCRKAAPARG